LREIPMNVRTADIRADGEKLGFLGNKIKKR